jgi:hypothetical protein
MLTGLLGNGNVGKSVGHELEIESILPDSRPHRLDFTKRPPRGSLEAGTPTVREPKASEKPDAPTAPSHVLIRTLSCVLIAAALAGLLFLSRHVAQQRAFDAVAFNDVLSVLKALDELGDGAVLDLTIRGPGSVPGLRGASVSDGSTLYVRRGPGGETYVRGSHDRGSLTYRFHAGSLYASEE